MKKAISIFILLAICLGLCACKTVPSQPEETDERLNYTILDSGACTSTILWEIRSNNTLYILGSGCTPNYHYNNTDGEKAPWLNSPMHQHIKNVYIGDGITGIGKYNFYDRILSSIRIGPNVVLWNFNGIYKVDTIYIPSCLRTVGDHLIADIADVNTKRYCNTTIHYEGSEEEWYSMATVGFIRYKEINFNSYK